MKKKVVLLVYIVVILAVFAVALSRYKNSEYKTSFIQIAPMNVARQGHMAVLLNSGKVLVAGGQGAGNFCYKSAELFDPEKNLFTNINEMNFPHCFNKAVKLKDGKVLILDGDGRSSEIFDPETQEFSIASMFKTKRYLYEANILQDGNVLVTGGGEIVYPAEEKTFKYYDRRYCEKPIFSTTEIFDNTNNEFKKFVNMSSPRCAHASVLLENNNVLLAGGSGLNSDGDWKKITASAEIYNSDSGMFVKTGKMNTERAGFLINTLSNGNVLVTGGENPNKTSKFSEIYDISTGSFRVSASPIINRNLFYDKSVTLDNGNVLFIGQNVDEVYDAMLDKFVYLRTRGENLIHHQVTNLNDGRVLITGGQTGTSLGHFKVLKNAEIFVGRNK